MAVIGARELQPVNILGSYVQGMEVGQQARAQRAKEVQADAAARQQQALNSLLQSGALSTPEGRNMLTRTPGGLDVLKAYGETEEKLGKGLEAQTKGLSDRLQYWKRMLPADPRLAPSWVASAYKDSIVGPELAKLGSAEQVVAGIPQDPGQYMQWVEGVSMFADEYAKRRVPTAEAMLQYTQPMSEDVFNQQRALRTAGASRIINQPPVSETERGKTVGRLGGESLVAEYNAVAAAAKGLAKDYEALKVLREGKPSTGITSELSTNFNRIISAVANDPEAAERVSDSQYLEALLGSDVFQQIGALGIGARGLDTPAEREFLREVISGTRKLNKETLIRMAELRAKYKEEAVQDYNERIESGELDDFFADFGRPKRKFTLPERRITLSPEDQEALNWANSNPNDARATQIKQRLGVR